MTFMMEIGCCFFLFPLSVDNVDRTDARVLFLGNRIVPAYVFTDGESERKTADVYLETGPGNISVDGARHR